MTNLTIELDPITDEPDESRLHHAGGYTLAVLPGTVHESGRRIRVYRPVHGVKASRIFGLLRAEKNQLEAVAAKAVGEGLHDIVIL